MDSVVVSSSTQVETLSDPPLVLRLKTKEYPHVTWASNVVDNEGLGRLKSNCCCIYVPPRDFDDPSTWVADECESLQAGISAWPLSRECLGKDRKRRLACEHCSYTRVNTRTSSSHCTPLPPSLPPPR